MSALRIMTVVGARPEFIKAGPVTRAFAQRGVEEILVHTGQHYDSSMSDIFFEALGLRPADHFLGAGSGSHGNQTGKMLAAVESLILETMPDAVLVYGDTNSTLAGALSAVKLHIPVVHIEAGLRSFNRRMPEEINRILTDHISNLLFCPTQTAVDNLAAEGIREGVHLVGDVNQDALDYWKQSEKGRVGFVETLPQVQAGAYYVATVHRAENVDDPARLASILHALNSLDYPVVLPVHPRTAGAMSRLDLGTLTNVIQIEPVGFLEMLELIQGSRAVLTDSGGVQKEAYMLGVPCITLRHETEWVETVETGWNVIAGTEAESIVRAVTTRALPEQRPPIFGDGHASEKIVESVVTYLSDLDGERRA